MGITPGAVAPTDPTISDPIPAPTPIPTDQMVPVFTVRKNDNFIVVMDNVPQTPTHISPFEACQHAGKLKMQNPGKIVNITTSGVVECTLEKV